MPDGHGKRRLLVVDDEPDLVYLYTASLGDEYDVFDASGGLRAIETIDEVGQFDVALIDRRMPGVSGDEVLEHLRSVSPNCRVAMVTAVEPDFDILSMPFDEYLVKPITRVGIRETVERLLRLEDYREQRYQAYALASKVAALRAHKDPEELSENEDYRELVERLEALRAEIDEMTANFDTHDFVAAFSELEQADAQPTRSA